MTVPDNKNPPSMNSFLPIPIISIHFILLQPQVGYTEILAS